MAIDGIDFPANTRQQGSRTRKCGICGLPYKEVDLIKFRGRYYCKDDCYRDIKGIAEDEIHSVTRSRRWP